jgi:hypothetical protein
MLIENQRPLSTGGKMGKYALVVALVVRKRPSMTMAANTSLAGSIRLFR